ncbi:MAG: hypothetical protein Q8N61_00270, partial [bacterium]|nr:hypothetical protein [bacterium]
SYEFFKCFSNFIITKNFTVVRNYLAIGHAIFIQQLKKITGKSRIAFIINHTCKKNTERRIFFNKRGK